MTSNFRFPPPPPPPPPSLPDSHNSKSGPLYPSTYQNGRGASHFRGQRGGNRGGNRGFYGSGNGFNQSSRGGYSYQQRNGFSNSTHNAQQASYRQNWSGNSYTQNQAYSGQSVINQTFIPTAPETPRHQSNRTNPPAKNNSTLNGVDSQKRQYDQAFGKNDIKRKVVAAPSVPSFGLPLPTVVPAAKAVDEPKEAKKRKHNGLGLTPAEEEPEMSEDDADEEAKLAAAASNANGSNVLSFSYRGKNSTLRTAEEIAAWIEERRKSWPTKARTAEMAAKKACKLEAAAQKAKEIAKQKAEKRQAKKQTNRNIKKSHDKTKPKDQGKEEGSRGESLKKSLEAPNLTLSEIEKLQKNLEETQRELAKLRALQEMQETRKTRAKESNTKKLKVLIDEEIDSDADSSIPSSSSESEPASDSDITSSSGSSSEDSDVSTLSDDASGLSSPSITSKGFKESLHAYSKSHQPISSKIRLQDTLLVSNSTQKSGLDSDSDSDSSLPSQRTTHHDDKHPRRIPPPSRDKERKRPLCRNLQKYGQCQRKFCKYRHKVKDKDERGIREKGPEKKAEKLSLYQRLLKQQIEEEEKEAAMKSKPNDDIGKVENEHENKECS
jgi:hypothetical protein